MKTNAGLSVGKVLLCGLLVGVACLIYEIADSVNENAKEKELEQMSVEDLTQLMNECVKEDTEQSYLQACKIRDLIKLKKAG